MTANATTSLDEIIENFALLDDWEDRYGYLIELGRELEPLSGDEMCDANKVRGCASQVWLVPERRDGRIYFRGGSDAHIVSGLVAVALAIFSGRTPDEIGEQDAQAVFDRIGLAEHITAQRANGLRSMVERIKAIAAVG